MYERRSLGIQLCSRKFSSAGTQGRRHPIVEGLRVGGQVCIVQKKNGGHQLYAMKYMSKNQCAAREALRNVLREVEILTQLDHPFLVNLWFSFQGIRKVEFRGSVPTFTWRMENHLGKTTLSTPGYDLNSNLPGFSNLVYCESNALNHAATEAAPSGGIQVISFALDCRPIVDDGNVEEEGGTARHFKFNGKSLGTPLTPPPLLPLIARTLQPRITPSEIRSDGRKDNNYL
uniref:Protein kinase domain-containing protein n=1 Tax=Timema genevievae TaxID=629358 RepID=A0A7R9JNH1_TIMGE|nr:unnamed protein product [Timema genevievae]